MHFALGAERRQDTGGRKMKEKIILIVILVAIFYIGYEINRAIVRLKASIYRKIFPLDKPVDIKIDREVMNSMYYQLTKEEVEILEKTNNCEATITRKIKNELVITVGANSWTVYQASYGVISNDWVKYFRNSFVKPKKIAKKIVFKMAMVWWKQKIGQQIGLKLSPFLRYKENLICII